MKTLIIGEIINNNLSSGTLEILGKAKSLDLDVQVVTVGSDENPSIGLDLCKQTYLKRQNNSLNLSKVATKISEMIKNEEISLILGSSTYMCRDLISFLSVDLNSSPVSNVIDFDVASGNVSTVNSINGGESLYKTKINSDQALLLIRPKAFDPVVSSIFINTFCTDLQAYGKVTLPPALIALFVPNVTNITVVLLDVRPVILLRPFDQELYTNLVSSLKSLQSIMLQKKHMILHF